MVLDTPALVAVLRDEPEAAAFARAIAGAPVRRLSVVNRRGGDRAGEAAIVIDGARDPLASRGFDRFARAAGLLLEPVDAEQGWIAREACRDFGRGSGRPARPNFGDRFA